MLHLVLLVRTDVSEEHIAFIIRVARIGDSSILFIPMREAKCSFEMSILIRVTFRLIPEDDILQKTSQIPKFVFT
jgi:hypothetical protein